MTEKQKKVLRAAEAAAYTGLSESTLAKRRLYGKPPAFLSLGGRAIGYAIDELDRWLDSCRCHPPPNGRARNMRRPPENQTAPVAGGGGGDSHAGSSIRDLELKPILPASRELIFTAVPTGARWQLKCLFPNGDIAYLGCFDDRLRSLGASVLLAEHCGGRVVP